jgi:hypothetical protein
MLGNLHVRFGVGAGVKLPGLHHKKSLSAEQRAEAADAFGAEGAFLSAGKKLVDTSHPAFKCVTAVRGRILALWKASSLPYVENGIRLVRQDRIEEFNARMQELREELDEAVWRLDEHFAEVKSAARQRLGRLFNPADYPDSLRGLFAVEWDYPNVDAPDFLRELNPRLFREECQRVQARFDEAVRLAEEAFTSELSKLVSHLAERLSGHEPKTFRDSTVANLNEFFQRFRELNIGSNEQLDQLVVEAQRVIRGVTPQDLRDNVGLRQRVAKEMGRVQSALDVLMVDKPRRNILRRPR